MEVNCFKDADLDKAAKAAAFSIVANSGQVCMASSRVYVQESILEEFKPLYLQAPGRYAAAEERLRVCTAGQDDELRVLLDCSDCNVSLVSEGNGNFVSPVVLHDVLENHRIMKEEIFG